MPSSSSPPSSRPPVSKREIFSWCCYDFANSSFTTVIITTLFSVYFVNVICENSSNAHSLWALAIGVSQGVVILLSPFLGALADISARKKQFLIISAILCSLLTASLYWTGPGTILLALTLVILANICFSLGENFCASFLPEISTPENCGRISGYGWSFGYIGGLICLGIAFLIITQFESHDIRGKQLAFAMTGLFFLVSTLPPFLFLRERATSPPTLPSFLSLIRQTTKTLGSTFKQLSQYRSLCWFFLAFLFYMSGLVSIISFASIFAEQELHFDFEELILLFAGLNISSAIGAFTFGFLQDRIGPRITLILSLFIWIGVSLGTVLCTDKLFFTVLGCIAGFVIGSTQSASRAVVRLLTPQEKAGEFFGFWGQFGKLSALIGVPLFAYLSDTISIRTAVGVNSLFFLVGLCLLLFLNLTPIHKK